MKTSILKIGFIVLFVCQSLLVLADYKDEILKLSRIDLLAQYQANVAVKQISSYDTTGGNDDGFSGKYSFLRKENDALVIADLKGPGIIQRIWTPTPTSDTIQFFFDGETVPRIAVKFIELFSGEKYPFLKPVVGNEVGGYYCYLPIPYKNSCKIVFKGKRMQFFQIQYKETIDGNTIASFPQKFSKEEDQALSAVINVWKNSGSNITAQLPVSQNQVKTSVKNVVLKPGDIVPVFSRNGGGRIVGIEIVPLTKLNDQFKDLILRTRWDNEPVPAINSPLSDFFGYAFGKPSMQSMLVGVKEDVHYCYLPMPFDKKASIELEFIKSPHNQTAGIPVKVTVYYSETKRSANEGKLYVEWKRVINPEMGKPYEILDKKGRGHYVGTLLQAQGLNSGMTLFFEGDDECYVDGQLRLHGTGSEDYFNGGWYAVPNRWDQAFSLPLSGCLAYSIPLARTGGYRFYITDKISFEKNIHLTIEHSGVKNSIPVDYTSVAFYYCDTPPASNSLPPMELLAKENIPNTMEYLIQLLPVKVIGKGTTITNEDFKDKKSGKNYNVFRLESKDNGFAKFELEVPSNGEYKLYLSYFKGPDCSPFEINQRQIPVSAARDAYAPEYTFTEKEYFGTLSVKEGTNNITVALKNGSQKLSINKFLLHRIYLEKN